MEAVKVVDHEIHTVSRRWLGWLDVGVLMLTLLIFILFLMLLGKLVFPEGARLGDIMVRDGGSESMQRGQSRVAI